jgi:hypothetical protein
MTDLQRKEIGDRAGSFGSTVTAISVVTVTELKENEVGASFSQVWRRYPASSAD